MHLTLGWIFACTMLLAGCRSHQEFVAGDRDDYYQAYATAIEFADPGKEPSPDVYGAPVPLTVRGELPDDYWELSLEEAIRIGLANSEVIRDLGGRVLQPAGSQPGVPGTSSVYDVAIQESSVNFGQIGPEAALSAFDARLNSSLIFNRNEQAFNNEFQGGGVNSLSQNTAMFDFEIGKTAATGTQFALRHRTAYDDNTAPMNLFRDAYTVTVEGEVVQPLGQGAGLLFNRIAGPSSAITGPNGNFIGASGQPGNYNGVLIARVNTDIALATFEQSVRDFVFSVEQTYWQLYFAYRDLESKMKRRDALLEAWRVENARFEVGDARQQDEALAREAYYAAQAEVENALSGTTTSGLVVATAAGVYTLERQLRLLMGIPVNDGRLIRPASDPARAQALLDWQEALATAMMRRVELRRQKWSIRRREMELLASEEFLKMRLDFVGLYRFRGFGDKLFGEASEPNETAVDDLFTGKLQDWQLGFRLSTPIGNRIGHTAVRNAEWQLARERAVLRQQEQQVWHDLSAAYAEVERAFSVTRAYFNRRVAAYQRLELVRIQFQERDILLRELLDAERFASESDSNYYRALVDYNLALANFERQRGSLLDYNGVYLAEGPWSPQAHASARKQARRFKRRMHYVMTVPPDISAGDYPQGTARTGMIGEEEAGPGSEEVPPEDELPLPAAPKADKE